MKKVLVLAAVLSLVATQAMALSIVNTKHDLSSGSTATLKGNIDELCVYCHTPHGGANGTGKPLWNRSTTIAGISLAAADLYNSATLTDASRPTTVAAGLTSTDAVLCLSCHDGASLSGALTNPSSAGPPTIGNIAANNIANLDMGNVGLSNDHPIGMVYATAYTQDGGATGGLKASPANGVSFWGGVMWCSSCHDVHDTANAPFLVKSNGGSCLCLECHNK